MESTKAHPQIIITGFNEKLVETSEGRDAILGILIPAIDRESFDIYQQKQHRDGTWECLGSFLGMVYRYSVKYSNAYDADIVLSIHRFGTVEEYEEQELRQEVSGQLEMENQGWARF